MSMSNIVSPPRRQFLMRGMALSLAAGLAPVRAEPGSDAAKAPLAFVLGGGSARGFAHIGVIKAMDAAGIKPDLIVGTSAGSLIGVFWAAGISGARMEELALNVRDDEVIDLIAGTGQRGMVVGRHLQDFVNRYLPNNKIEALPTRFIAVATQFPSGELVGFSKGDAGFAVRASCSIPGVFLPASDNGHEYLDGGLVSPIPVQTARKAGAELVAAVDIGAPDSNVATRGSLYGLILRSFEIMSQSLRNYEAAQADLVIRPSVAQIPSTDFGARKVLIAAGFQAGSRMAPLIKERLGRPGPAPRRKHGPA
jgi:NTE family protein